MVGGRGKGKAPVSRSKFKDLAVACVEPEPEPLKVVVEGSADCPSNDGEEENNEISDGDEASVEETRDENVCGPVIGNGHEEREQLVNQLNDEEGFTGNKMATNGAEDILMYEQTEEDDEESGDEDGATCDVATEEHEEIANELSPEQYVLGDKDANHGEERKNLDGSTEEGIITDEDLPAPENGKLNEATGKNLQLGETEQEPQVSIGTPASKPQRKLVRKSLAKSNTMPASDLDPADEAKLQVSIGNDPSNEANKASASNEGKAGLKSAAKVNKKLKRIRRKIAAKRAAIAAASDGQHSKPTNELLENKDIKENDKSELKTEDAAKSVEKLSLSKKKRKNKTAMKGINKMVSSDVNDAGPSKKEKSPKKVDGMGMIFMCSSETKKDCYRYKVLGLPAGKKDIVMKIYKGMRLFLFDLELRMMYGIYKAAGPGGYNIEPRAFKSQFPSQVRFTVLADCLPLAEEKFKKVIKENYYTKNKFNCQLSGEQVKNLCKLFNSNGKRTESKPVSGVKNPVVLSPAKRAAPSSAKRAAPSSAKRAAPSSAKGIASSSVQQDRKRKRAEDSRRGAQTSLKRERGGRWARGAAERVPVVLNDRYYHHRHPVAYERETYVPPAAPAAAYQTIPVPDPPLISAYSYERDIRADLYRRDVDPPRTTSFSYERDVRMDPYRREAPLEDRDIGHYSSRDLRQPIETGLRDPYITYADPRVYREVPEPVYATEVRQEHYDYSSDRRPVEYYRPAVDYRAPLPPYRRY